jgi:hypothetical protein
MIRPATVFEVAVRVLEPDMEGLVINFNAAEWLTHSLALTDGHNMLLATENPDKVYEIHYLLRDRGRKALQAGVDFFRHLYDDYEARTIIGMVPAHKRAARWFSRHIGGTSHGLVSTDLGFHEIFSLTREEFEARHGFSCKQERKRE